jgi:hypothetical protein
LPAGVSTLSARVASAADRFWTLAGKPAGFPRDVESCALLTLPVMIARLPRLGIFSAQHWLREHGYRADWHEADRQLHALLFAAFGNGCILLDGCDTEDEQRYSVAHEVAHFLLEHHAPRARVIARLRPALLDVLDGKRPPTTDERADALLAGVSLGVTRHTLERGPLSAASAAIARSEDDADRLALELLAPEAAVWERLPFGGTFGARLGLGAAVLAKEFGLPPTVAAGYAHASIIARDGTPGWRAWLTSGGA